MLNRFVANWLREQAVSSLSKALESSDSQSTAESTQRVDLVVFFPAGAQAGGFVDRLGSTTMTECAGFTERIGELGGRRIAVVETSELHQKLSWIARDVISLRQPSWVVSTGFAQALRSELRRGQFLIANQLHDRHGYSLKIETQTPPSARLHVGSLLTVETGAEIPNRETSEVDGPLAWDLQAAVLGEVCRVLKRKMIAFHAIGGVPVSDQGKLTKEIKTQETLAGKLGAAAGALFNKPSSFRELWEDQQSTLILSDGLAKMLEHLLPQLPVE